MQSAGFFINKINARKPNGLEIKNKDKITIICLGESTTYYQYPGYLEEYLKKYCPGKQFNVIDAGKNAAKMEDLRHLLKEKMKKDVPDIVVGMLGINDMIDYSFMSYSKFKTVFLFQLIREHFKLRKIKLQRFKIERKADPGNSGRKIADNLSRMLFYKDAGSRLKDFMLPEAQKGSMMCIYGMDNEFFARFILKYYEKNDRNADFERILNDMYDDETIKKEFRYAIKGLYNMLNGNYDLGEKYINKADRMRMSYDYKNISKNYEKILDEIIPKKTKYLAMQYPVRNVNSLKKIISGTKYKDDVLFVSNKNNFMQALRTGQRNEIFTDLFAWDFGHCKEYGNRLIADNLAKEIACLLSSENIN